MADSARYDNGLWLWVPACAGTTPDGGTQFPAKPPV